jgi:hypothetical protein
MAASRKLNHPQKTLLLADRSLLEVMFCRIKSRRAVAAHWIGRTALGARSRSAA